MRAMASAKFTPVALTRTRTCPSPGSGSGASRTSSTSGPPLRRIQTCRMSTPSVLLRGFHGPEHVRQRRGIHGRELVELAAHERFAAVDRHAVAGQVRGLVGEE